MLRNPSLTAADRDTLERAGAAADVLTDYVLSGLCYATISTISWTPLRGAAAEVLLLTSDGIHKQLSDRQILDLVERHPGDAGEIAAQLVDAAVTAPVSDPHEDIDNATAAVLTLTRKA